MVSLLVQYYRSYHEPGALENSDYCCIQDEIHNCVPKKMLKLTHAQTDRHLVDTKRKYKAHSNTPETSNFISPQTTYTHRQRRVTCTAWFIAAAKQRHLKLSMHLGRRTCSIIIIIFRKLLHQLILMLSMKLVPVSRALPPNTKERYSLRVLSLYIAGWRSSTSSLATSTVPSMSQLARLATDTLPVSPRSQSTLCTTAFTSRCSWPRGSPRHGRSGTADRPLRRRAGAAQPATPRSPCRARRGPRQSPGGR